MSRICELQSGGKSTAVELTFIGKPCWKWPRHTLSIWPIRIIARRRSQRLSASFQVSRMTSKKQCIDIDESSQGA
jgi:hypothetical protein